MLRRLTIVVVQSRKTQRWGYCPEDAEHLLRPELADDGGFESPEAAIAACKADDTVPKGYDLLFHVKRPPSPQMQAVRDAMYAEGCEVAPRGTAVLNARTLRVFIDRGAQLLLETAACSCGEVVRRLAVGEKGTGPWAWVHESDVGDLPAFGPTDKRPCPHCGAEIAVRGGWMEAHDRPAGGGQCPASGRFWMRQ
jgi:hypothetical protein